MFIVKDDKSIHITRGDIGILEVDGRTDEKGLPYTFAVGEEIRLQVFEAKKHENVVLRKTITVESETEIVEIPLTKDDTKIGPIINKPTEYWYEIELNPETMPQTLLGYDDEEGPKVFMLYPEGADK